MVSVRSPVLITCLFWVSAWAYISSEQLNSIRIQDQQTGAAFDPNSILGCHKRVYNSKVSKADSQGRTCWDTISVMSCWGRCDSREISDWRFPYKRSFHPVCLFDSRELATVTLSNCEEGVEPGTEFYQYLQAVSCRCLVCKSSEASCEGVREAI
ncbi:glycoprotein hormone beta 5 isoform X2 [Lycorma delicatula]